MSSKVFKVVLVGKRGCGKSAWVDMLLEHKFVEEYVPTLGVNAMPISVKTSHGRYTINMWEIGRAGLDPSPNYYLGAQGCIAMFDRTAEQRFDPTLLDEYLENVPNGPIVIVASKCKNTLNADVVISTKTRQNINAPLEVLLRQMTKKKDLKVIEV